jgi:hypothetical protein
VPDWTLKKIHNLWETPESPMTNVCAAAATFSFPRSHDGKRQLRCDGEILAQVWLVQDNVLSFAQITPEEIRSAWKMFAESTEDKFDDSGVLGLSLG